MELLLFFVGILTGMIIGGLLAASKQDADFTKLIIERDDLRQRLDKADNNDNRGPDGRYTGKK